MDICKLFWCGGECGPADWRAGPAVARPEQSEQRSVASRLLAARAHDGGIGKLLAETQEGGVLSLRIFKYFAIGQRLFQFGDAGSGRMGVIKQKRLQLCKFR